MSRTWFDKLFHKEHVPGPTKAICVVNRSRDFDRLVKVLFNSWEAHNQIPLEIHNMPDGWDRKYKHGLWVNTLKLEKWAELFQQDTIFLDADLLCTGDMSKPFEMIYHLGYTENKARGRILNAGVFYAKYTDYSKLFFAEWVKTNRDMLNSQAFHTPWRRKYMGINQAALGFLIEKGWNIEKLPEKYNLCDWTPEKVKDAHMIHVKSDLRVDMLMGGGKYPHVAKIWRKYET